MESKKLFKYFRMNPPLKSQGAVLMSQIFYITKQAISQWPKDGLIPYQRAIEFTAFMDGEEEDMPEERKQLRERILKQYGKNYPRYDQKLYEE